MTIHREGFNTLGIVLVSEALLVLAIYLLAGPGSVFFLVLAAAFALLLIFLQFFRLPTRIAALSASGVLSPCDGKVVVIEEVEEPEYFKGKRLQVSIFMSPINVHANWTPVAGKVTYAKYHPGKYLVAWHPKSSTENERTTVVLQRSDGIEILFRQIAGALAKRICLYAKSEMTYQQGEEFGFIKFGSRVDIYLPVNAQVNVSIGDKVKGKITTIAQI